MGDSRLTFQPGDPLTLNASADIAGGQLVEITGAMAAGPGDAATGATWLGTAAFDAKTGQKVTVLIGGVQPIIASGVIAAGASVVAAADGKVKTRAAETVDTIVGIALTGGTDVAVDVLMAR